MEAKKNSLAQRIRQAQDDAKEAQQKADEHNATAADLGLKYRAAEQELVQLNAESHSLLETRLDQQPEEIGDSLNRYFRDRLQLFSHPLAAADDSVASARAEMEAVQVAIMQQFTKMENCSKIFQQALEAANAATKEAEPATAGQLPPNPAPVPVATAAPAPAVLPAAPPGSGSGSGSHAVLPERWPGLPRSGATRAELPKQGADASRSRSPAGGRVQQTGAADPLLDAAIRKPIRERTDEEAVLTALAGAKVAKTAGTDMDAELSEL